jgi:hypothetical protein
MIARLEQHLTSDVNYTTQSLPRAERFYLSILFKQCNDPNFKEYFPKLKMFNRMMQFTVSL